jgi:2'-5' RNA ligase
MPTDPAPLIVTLTLDPQSQAWFDALRRAHFPADRLLVGAHITLFHALPGAHAGEAADHLAALCATTTLFPVTVTGLRHLGRGVAFTLGAPQAKPLRAQLAAAFAPYLTPQDRARWSPHITVQNKVSAERAHATLAYLSDIVPPAAQATGLALWHYRNGPWEAACSWNFAGSPPALTRPSPHGELPPCT